MGIFNFIGKEIYINVLAKFYMKAHDCDAGDAIRNLRKNYESKELKAIVHKINFDKDMEIFVDEWISLRRYFDKPHI